MNVDTFEKDNKQLNHHQMIADEFWDFISANSSSSSSHVLFICMQPKPAHT